MVMSLVHGLCHGVLGMSPVQLSWNLTSCLWESQENNWHQKDYVPSKYYGSMETWEGKSSLFCSLVGSCFIDVLLIEVLLSDLLVVNNGTCSWQTLFHSAALKHQKPVSNSGDWLELHTSAKPNLVYESGQHWIFCLACAWWVKCD